MRLFFKEKKVFKNMKLKTKIYAILLIGIVGLITFGIFSFQTIDKVKVNGSLYSRIVQGKDLIADVLPPPEYIIESYLTVLQMATETNGDKMEGFIAKGIQLKKDYDTRHEFWMKDLENGNLKQFMGEDSYKPAIDFYTIRDNEFIPAIKKGDKNKVQDSLEKLKLKYEQHRLFIDKVVALSIDRNANDEKEGKKIIYNNFIYLLGLMLLIIAIISVIGFNVINSINSVIKNLFNETKKLFESVENGDLAARGNVESINSEFKNIIEGINSIMDAFSKPIKITADYLSRIAKGDTPPKITEDYKGDFNEIKNSLNESIDAISTMVSEVGIVMESAGNGKLGVRTQPEKSHGVYRKILKGVNETLDELIAPLNVAAEYIDSIAKGKIPDKITDNYKGDFDEIKNNLNKCIDSINLLIEDANMLTRAAISGNFSVRVNAMNHYGDFRRIIDGVNNTLDAIVNPLTSLINDVNNLTDAAKNGHLHVRADINSHTGEFRKVIEGVNETLDELVKPLNVAGEYIDRISKGDIPPKITENYKGDFNELKTNLNKCIDSINLLISSEIDLYNEINNGNLTARIDVSKHQGDFKDITAAYNNILDSIISPLNVAADYIYKIAEGNIPAKITKEYKGDFNIIKNNINTCIDNISSLIKDINKLSDAAVKGHLGSRADASLHHGDFSKIINGINDILDSVIEPVKEAVNCLREMANGNLAIRMEGVYEGEHDNMKANINKTLDEFNEIISHVLTSSEQVVQGSQQISDASQALSQGATEQASSLEEITSSITELSSQIKINAENANQANNLTNQSRTFADEGNNQMTEMVVSMSDIMDSSKNISRIIKVIDEIAFQTNLLALNAAVEAARAGKHGKGFAVVAEEVRNLASRSSTAARETSELIENSINKAEKGAAIANKTAEALSNIVESVIKTADIVNEIAIASNEQAHGIAELNLGLNQIEKVTQHNTASSEESASAAEELNGQAYTLKQMLSRFILKNDSCMIGKSYTKQLINSAFHPESAKMLKASDVIAIDDAEFGRY